MNHRSISKPKFLPKGSIVHTYPDWLPLTMNWVHSFISRAENYQQCVLTEKIQNKELFELKNIYVLSAEHPILYPMEFLLRKLKVYRQLPLFNTVLRESKPLLLHSHFANFAWRDALIAKSLNIPHVVSVYGADISMLPYSYPKWKNRINELFSSVTAVVCEGPAMAKKVSTLGAKKELIWTIPLGADVNKIKFKPRVWSKGEPLKILIAASFRYKKGIPDTLMALSQIAKEIPIQIYYCRGCD